MTGELSFFIALTAGAVSFLSPCVLPLVPAYVTFITGSSLDELTDPKRGYSPHVLRHGLLFVLGFSLINVLLGGSAGFLGTFLIVTGRIFEVIGGIFLILFGILLLGIIRIPWVDRDWGSQLTNRPVGNLRTIFAGMVFSIAWTPCRGPIIGAILTLGAAGEAPVEGMVLLGGYSLGLAIPFLLAAVGLSRFLTLRGRIRPMLPWIQRGSSVILILLGILLLTGDFARITAELANATPQFLLERM